MQVLLRRSEDKKDVDCSVCGQGFRIYWERTSDAERVTVKAAVIQELAQHHKLDLTAAAHPTKPFTYPEWTGSPQYSGAALLGGLSGLHRVAGPELDLKRS